VSLDILEREIQTTESVSLAPRWSHAVWPPLAALAGWTMVRASGAERWTLPVQLMAFTPYVAATALALPPVAAAMALASRGRGSRSRRWSPVVLSTLVAVALAWCVLPRAVADAPTAADRAMGPVLRVMTSNLLFGSATVADIVRIVSERKVDLLAVQELTPQSAEALGASPLVDLLPYRVVRAELGAGGSGLYSRFPLRGEEDAWFPGGFARVRARVDVPGAQPVAMESVHTYAPVSADATADWTAGFAALPPAPRSGPVGVLLGDFNATLDHAPMRRLLGTGYRDAAATMGTGLVPTWPFDGRAVPRVTIDHVLADRRVGIRAASVHRVPGSDHRAVLAELVLPPA
jgi:endonuclease/exonuclease/phosphatase (EEP) superfamily protein YafD